MRTTLNVDRKLLEDVKALSGAKTQTQAVEIALKEFVQSEWRQKLVALIGNWDDFGLTLEDLEKMRDDD